MKRQHAAVRQCVGCTLKRDQSALTRFLRSVGGTVLEDLSLTREGRGAYVCSDTKERCLLKAIQRNSFDRSIPVVKK
jgi:predicted RNA-binding protein YlxR (DUF448 family)